MAKLLDKILVVDIECTCWDGIPPPGQISEIIEIGIAVVDVATLQRQEKRSILVKPTNSEISAFCTQLTTLTAEHLKDAGSLVDAVKALMTDFQSQDRLWASWGDFDREQFARECKDKGVEYPFGASHLNVKTLYSVTYGLTGERGMAAALRRLGIPLEGTHHRGADDAWNIAGILCHMLQNARQK